MQLYSIDQDFKNLANEQFGIYLINESRIKLFREKNAMQLKIMASRFMDIQSKYVKQDAQGTFQTIDNNGTLQWDFIDSYVSVAEAKTLTRDEVIERFEKECKAFYEQHVSIEY